MTTISRRINQAIKHLSENDYENALIQIAPAIDVTAKKYWPGLKPGHLIKIVLRKIFGFAYSFALKFKMVLFFVIITLSYVFALLIATPPPIL